MNNIVINNIEVGIEKNTSILYLKFRALSQNIIKYVKFPITIYDKDNNVLFCHLLMCEVNACQIKNGYCTINLTNIESINNITDICRIQINSIDIIYSDERQQSEFNITEEMVKDYNINFTISNIVFGICLIVSIVSVLVLFIK